MDRLVISFVFPSALIVDSASLLKTPTNKSDAAINKSLPMY